MLLNKSLRSFIRERGLVAETEDESTGSGGDPSIAPYHQGLNGVNQPANLCFAYLLWSLLGIVAIVIAVVRIRRLVSARWRRGSNPSIRPIRARRCLSYLKRHLVHAPLFHHRRARKTWLWGALPNRLQGFILSLFFASNIAYTLAVDYHDPDKYALLAEIRGRTGTLAAANLVPLILFASRNNPLVHLLGISYDTYVLLHRWVGRTMVIEGILHAASWSVVMVADKGWPGLGQEILHDHFISAGFAGFTALVFLCGFSLRPVRSTFYEVFLALHILLAACVIACAIVHCKLSGIDLPQTPWIITSVALWGTERILRILRMAISGMTGRGWEATARVEVLPGEVCRVTMSLPRHVTILPGSFAYIRMCALRRWETHPFSIAWSEQRYSQGGSTESVAEMGNAASRGMSSLSTVGTDVSFIIAAQTGFTRALFDAATKVSQAEPGACFHSRCSFEGPYDGHESFEYECVLLVAGGTGITHMLGIVRRLLGVEEHEIKGMVRRIVLVWIVRDLDALGWVSDWLEEIMEWPTAAAKLTVKIFVTRPRTRTVTPEGPRCDSRSDFDKEFGQMSRTMHTWKNLDILDGRPNVDSFVADEVGLQIGTAAVVVCGPGALADDVRNATRKVQGSGQVDFHEASFGW